MSKYLSLGHSKTRIFYHIIFATKYRKKLLSPIREQLFSYLKSAENGQFKISQMEIDKDHIHFLINAKPSISPYMIVHVLKQKSTYMMWHNNWDYMHSFYWKQHHLWTRGYFCSTIGEISEKGIRYYIENQG